MEVEGERQIGQMRSVPGMCHIHWSGWTVSHERGSPFGNEVLQTGGPQRRKSMHWKSAEFWPGRSPGLSVGQLESGPICPILKPGTGVGDGRDVVTGVGVGEGVKGIIDSCGGGAVGVGVELVWQGPVWATVTPLINSAAHRFEYVLPSSLQTGL